MKSPLRKIIIYEGLYQNGRTTGWTEKYAYKWFYDYYQGFVSWKHELGSLIIFNTHSSAKLLLKQLNDF